MKFSTGQAFLVLILAFFSSGVLSEEAVYAQHHGNNGGNRTGASSHINSRVRFNLENRGNFSPSNFNRGNFNRGNVNFGNTINVRPTAIPRGGRYGERWNGRRYNTPYGWGVGTFAAGLVIGTLINTLPSDYIPIGVGGTNYLYSDGVFMQPSGNSYIIAQPPIGAIVPFIPDGCTTMNFAGVVYYNCSGIIYQPFYQGSILVYKLVQY